MYHRHTMRRSWATADSGGPLGRLVPLVKSAAVGLGRRRRQRATSGALERKAIGAGPSFGRSRIGYGALTLALSTVLHSGSVGGEEAENTQPTDPDLVRDASLEETEGELVWGEGHRYAGGLKAGQMHGRGTHTAPDGEVYEGDFVDGSRHGKGTLRFADGDVYVGDFRNNAMTGRGRLEWPNGDVYEGDFVNGIREGRGTMRRQSGGSYVGGFSNDQRHGLGHYRWRDGTLYKGFFYFGRQHGSGLKRMSSGELSYETWNDGELLAAVPVEAVGRCALNINGEPWMFRDDTCINGLAHGEGPAVALDGTAYIADGKFILGTKVRGDVRSLELPGAR